MLELWEDTKGPTKGEKSFRGRWLFYPHHLPDGHKERKRKRIGLATRQVYEQCDAEANEECNPLASVRAAHRVLCCWKSALNRGPSPEELSAAHAWFDSAWDDKREQVVDLDKRVDKPATGARRVLPVGRCKHCCVCLRCAPACVQPPSRASAPSRSASRRCPRRLLLLRRPPLQRPALLPPAACAPAPRRLWHVHRLPRPR